MTSNLDTIDLEHTIERLCAVIPEVITDSYLFVLNLDCIDERKNPNILTNVFNYFNGRTKIDNYMKKHQMKLYRFEKEHTLLLNSILKDVKSTKNITPEYLDNIEQYIVTKYKEYKIAFANLHYDSPRLYTVLFQFKSFVEKEAKPLFELPSKEIASFGGPLSDFFYNLNKYARESHVKPIAEKLLVKMGEVTRMDLERGTQRGTGYASWEGSISTADYCMSQMKELVCSLNIPEDTIYRYVGLNEAEIDKYQKKYQEYKSSRLTLW